MLCTNTAPTTLRPTRVSRFARVVSPGISFTSAGVGIGVVSVVPQPCGHSALRPRGWVLMLHRARRIRRAAGGLRAVLTARSGLLPARELVFLNPSGRAEFSAADLSVGTVGPQTLILATVRSHDQWNTTIYSGNDRYRGIKNLRALIFMNRNDMRDRDIKGSTTSTSWPPPATAAAARCTATRRSPTTSRAAAPRAIGPR
jgi:hypothetical protein